jgi:hypothetical protein
MGWWLAIHITDCDMAAFMHYIYTIRRFGSNLYLKLNKNSCSNAEGIVLVYSSHHTFETNKKEKKL